MGGAIKPSISPETRELIKAPEHRGLFKGVASAMGELHLGPKLADPEAKTQTRVLDNGDIEVTFIYPIDDNPHAADGRLYLLDKFVFDSKESEFKNFSRDFSYNGEGDRELWKPKLAKLKESLMSQLVPVDAKSKSPQYKKMPAVGMPSEEYSAAFALRVARSYSRPFTQPVRDLFAAKGKKSYFDDLAPALEAEGKLQIKLDHQENTYAIVRHPGANGFPATNELVFSYVVDDSDDTTTGRILLRDSFVISENGEILGHNRKWSVDSRDANPKERKRWEELAARLAALPKPTAVKAKAFVADLAPALEEIHPTAADAAPPQAIPLPTPQGPTIEMTPGNFNQAMNVIAGSQRIFSGKQVDPGLRMALMQAGLPASQGGLSYFDALAETIKATIDFNPADPRARFSARTKGERTIVAMELTLSEGEWAEKSDGVIRYMERFVFEKGKLTDVERSWKVEGADPKGRLAAVSQQLTELKARGGFPKPGQAETEQFLKNVLLPYLAPDLLYVGKPKAIQEKSLSDEEKMAYSALGEIHQKLKVTLSLPGVDPVLAGRMDHILTAIEYNDDNIAGALGELQQMAQVDGANPDVRVMAEIISLLIGGQFNEARTKAERFDSGLLKGAFLPPIDKIWRRTRTLETLGILAHVAADELEERSKESTAWTHRGPRLDKKAEEKVLAGLFRKANAFVADGAPADALAALRELRGIGEGKKTEELSAAEKLVALTDKEKEACDRLIELPFTEKLAMIAKERSQEIQAGQYFGLARGELFQKGYVSAAYFLARKVALEMMPKSRSLEGIDVFGQAAAGIIQLQVAAKAGPEAKKAVEAARSLAGTDPDNYKKEHKEALEKALADPQVKQLKEMEEATAQLNKKLAEQAGSKPTLPLFDLLKEMTGLNELEDKLRTEILKSQHFQVISDIGKRKTREERLTFYQQVFASLAENVSKKAPEEAEFLQGLGDSVTSAEFPNLPALEGAHLILGMIAGPIKAQRNQLGDQIIDEEIHRNAKNKAIEKEAPRFQNLAVLLAKATDEAAARPEAGILEILQSLTFDEKKEGEVKKLRDELVAHSLVKSLSQVASEPNPQERAKKYGTFCTGILQKGAFLQAAQAIAQEPLAKNREAFVQKLKAPKDPKAPQDQAGQQLAMIRSLLKGENIKELEALAHENSDEKRVGKIMAYVNDPSFQEATMGSFAVWLGRSLESGKIPEMVYHPQHPDKLQAESAVKEVKDFITLCEGRGNFGAKVGYGLPTFLEENAKPTMLLSMVGAGLVGPLAELKMLRFLRGLRSVRTLAPASRMATVARVGTNLASQGVGVYTEAFAFNFFHKVGDSAFDHSQGQWDNFGGDVKSTAALFAAMRLGHFASNTFSERVLTSGRWGTRWAGGRVAEPPSSAIGETPIGRVAIPQTAGPGVLPRITEFSFIPFRVRFGPSVARSGVPQLTPAGKVVKGGLDHGAAIGMMTGSGYLSRGFGWQKDEKGKDPGFTGHLGDAGIGYLNALLGFSTANGLSGGKFHQGIAAIKLRTRSLDAEPIGDLARAREEGLPSLLNGERKDVQLSDMNAGRENVELNIEPGTEVPLDQALLGREGQTVVVKKRDDGSVVLIDRPPPSSPAPTPGTDLAPAREPITINGETVPPNVEVQLFEGMAIRAGERQLGVSLSAQSPLVAEFAKLSSAYQMRLVQKLRAAKDIASLMKDLEKDWREGGPLTFQVLEALLKGELLLHNLPTELGFQARVRELMQAEVEQARREFRLENYELAQDQVRTQWSPLEAEFHLARRVGELRSRVGLCQEIGHLFYFLRESHLRIIDGVPVETLETWLQPRLFEVKRNEVEHELARAREELARLGEAPTEAGEKAVHDLNRTKWETRIAQLTRTLKVVEEDWLAAAERLREFRGVNDVPDVLGIRRKALDIGEQALHPLQGNLAPADALALLKLVQKYLEVNIPEDVGIAQSLLRVHLDTASPRAKRLLLNAPPEAKEVILRAYLGQSGARPMTEPAASEILCWLTKGGWNGTAEVVYGEVEGRSVPHLRVTYPGEMPASGGFGLIRGRTKQAEGEQILFTVPEFSEIVDQARAYVGSVAGRNGPNALYDPATRTYSNWVMHPECGSQIKIEFDEGLNVKKVSILYATGKGETQISAKFQEAKQALETAARKENLALEMTPMDLDKFYDTFPGEVRDLDLFEGIAKRWHEKPTVRYLERKGLKRNFKPGSPIAAAFTPKLATPEWLVEFLEKNFEGETFKPDQAVTEAKEANIDKALEKFGLTREQVLADASIVKKKYRQFSLQYHPDRAAGQGMSEAEAGEKFKEITNYNNYLETLVEQAKERVTNRGQEAPGAAAAGKPPSPDAESPPTPPERGIRTFLNRVEENVPGAHPLFEIFRGIRNWGYNQYYGEGWRSEVESRAVESTARKKAKAEKAAAKKPAKPPQALQPGPKANGPRLALPPETVLPDPRVAMGERASGGTLEFGQPATTWMGEFSGRTDEGTGYPPPGVKPAGEPVVSQDGIAFAVDAQGNATFLVADGMGARKNSEQAARTFLDGATNEIRGGADLREAIIMGNTNAFNSSPRDAGAVVVGARVIRPGAAGEPYGLEPNWVGDPRGYLFRPDSKGQYQLVYRIVPDTIGKRSEADPALRARVEKIGDALFNQPAEGVGLKENVTIRSTAEGEMADPARPGEFKKAEGLDTIALNERDVWIGASDFLEIPPEKIAELISKCKTTQEMRDAIYQEGFRRMEILRDARETGIKGQERAKIEYDGKTFYIDFDGRVFDAHENGKQVDRFVTDNIGLTVYLHNPQKPSGPPALPGNKPPPALPPKPEGGDGTPGGGATNGGTGTSQGSSSAGSASNGGKEQGASESNATKDPAAQARDEVTSRVSLSEKVEINFKQAADGAVLREKYGPLFSAQGVFLPRAKPRPVGMKVEFRFKLADGKSFLEGEGTVVAPLPTDSGPGMRIRFGKLSDIARSNLQSILKPVNPSPPAATAGSPTGGNPPPPQPPTPPVRTPQSAPRARAAEPARAETSAASVPAPASSGTAATGTRPLTMSLTVKDVGAFGGRVNRSLIQIPMKDLDPRLTVGAKAKFKLKERGSGDTLLDVTGEVVRVTPAKPGKKPEIWLQLDELSDVAGATIDLMEGVQASKAARSTAAGARPTPDKAQAGTDPKSPGNYPKPGDRDYL